MNYSIFRFTLNMYNHRSQASVAAFRGDTAVRLVITLTDGGIPYVIGDGCTAVLGGTKADGNKLQDFCVIENNTRIIYDFTEQTTSCPGIVNCDITLLDLDGKVITAPKFIIVVDEKEVGYDDAIESSSEFKSLERLLGVAVAEEGRVDAEIARKAGETLRQTAEEERKSDEEERESAEEARKSAEEERKSAEAERKTAEVDRKSAEDVRKTAEEERESAEYGRKSAENARAEADRKRSGIISSGGGEASVVVNGVESNQAPMAHSMSAGLGTITGATAQYACGSFNEVDTEAMAVVGAGTSASERANAFTAGKDGSDNMYIKVGKTKVTEGKVKKLLDILPKMENLSSTFIFDTVSTLATRHLVPTDALPYARIERVGGHSANNNLLRLTPNTILGESQGVTCSVDENGYLTIDSGGNDSGISAVFDINTDDILPTKPSSACILSARYISGTVTVSEYAGTSGLFSSIGNTELPTADNPHVISAGTSPSSTRLTIQAVGCFTNYKIEWQVLEGLRHAPVTAVESVGKNLAYSRGWSAASVNNGDDALSLSNPYGTTISATSGEVISVTQTAYSSTILGNYSNGYLTFPLAEHLTDGGKYNLSFDLTIKSNPLKATTISLLCNGATQMQIGGYAIENALNKKQRVFAPFTYTKRDDCPNAHYIEIRCMGMSFDIGNMMITREDVTDTTYTPCGLIDTFTIPEEVQALEGYGLGISAEYNNHIEFTEDGKAEYHREVFEFVFDKSMKISADFITGQSTYRFWINKANFTEHRFAANVPSADISLCDRLPPLRYAVDMVGYALDTVYDSIAIKSPYSTIQETKEWLHGTKFLFVKAEPEVTDISGMFSSDTYIKVEGGGYIEAKNEHESEAVLAMAYQVQN